MKLKNKIYSNLFKAYYTIIGTLMECSVDPYSSLKNNNEKIGATAHIKFIKEVEEYCESRNVSFLMVYKSLKRSGRLEQILKEI